MFSASHFHFRFDSSLILCPGTHGLGETCAVLSPLAYVQSSQKNEFENSGDKINWETASEKNSYNTRLVLRMFQAEVRSFLR